MTTIFDQELSELRILDAKAPHFSQEFCEECPDQKKVVMRNARYKDNASLPSAVEEMAGDNIYRGLRDGFRVSLNSISCECQTVTPFKRSEACTFEGLRELHS